MTAATEPVARMDDELIAESALLGRLAVPRGQAYRFDSGIYGFPDAKTFLLLPAENAGFFWLQSLEHRSLTYLVVDPFQFVPDYVLDVDGSELSELHTTDADDLLIVSIVTLPMSPEAPATLNLQGPLALDVVRKRGKQLVTDSPHGVRYPLDLKHRADSTLSSP